MKIFCLGAAGKISRESVLDLLQSGNPTRVTIGDTDEARGREVVAWLDDDRVDFVQADVFQTDQTADLMRDYDLVMDGTTISINHESTQCIARAGVHGVNLNGTGPEFAFHDAFVEAGKTYVPGFGMTPGITNVMARYAHDRLETVDTIRISHGAFRPFAFSPAITETTRIEYEPGLESRIVFEDGARAVRDTHAVHHSPRRNPDNPGVIQGEGSAVGRGARDVAAGQHAAAARPL